MEKLFTFYRWLSMRGNSFLVRSVFDEIGSAYAQHAHAIIYEKYQIKMQILTRNNRNFQKLSQNPSYRTKVKILKKKSFLDSSSKKFGSAYAQSPRKCSNIEILAKNRSEIFSENLPRAYKDLI
jgi:hypothetical protein